MMHPRFFSRAVRSLCAVFAASMLLCATAHLAHAQATTAPASDLIAGGLDAQTGGIRLLVNKSVTITTSRPYSRLQVVEPGIADVNDIDATHFTVRGVKGGSTQVIVYDRNNVSQTIEVLVQANLLQLRELYSRLMPQANIDIVDSDGVIALTGQVPTINQADQAAALAAGYGTKVLNLLEVAGGQQVLLQIRFAEVSRAATSQLGVNLGFIDTRGAFGASNIGLQQFTLEENAAGLSNLGDLPPSASVTLFGRGFLGNTTLEAFISALRDNNLLRVLAEPNLVAISGQEADFLAGGDFPVPIVQGGNDQGTSISVEFREFGVALNFLPVVLGDNRIRLRLNPEVSDVDFSNAVVAQGFRIPGRRTRRLSTTVELTDGQTFAVGGLLDNRVAANKQVTPLLGDLPVIGALFRSVRYQRNETELVVLVTPRLVNGLNPGDVPALPGEDWRHPSEVGLFLGGDIGGPRDSTTKMPQPARRYIGSYGFVPATQPSAK